MSDPLAALKMRFRVRAAADLDRLTRLWADEPETPELRALIHDLAGAAGIFGFPDLSAAALEIDNRHASGFQPDGVQMDRLFKGLREAAED